MASESEAAAVFKALSDPGRLRLLARIASQDEVCVCDLTCCLPVGQPTVSHHLKVLRQAGLVDCERRGTWVWYRARPEALHPVRDVLDALDRPVPAA